MKMHRYVHRNFNEATFHFSPCYTSSFAFVDDEKLLTLNIHRMCIVTIVLNCIK